MKKKLLLTLVSLAFLQLGMAQSLAEYDISFTSTWSNATHPDPTNNFPSNAHWSNLVGATHNNSVVFVAMGQAASAGIQDVAELGSNGQFQSEVQTAMNANNSDQWLNQGFSPFASISTATMTDVLVSSDFPLLSLAAMIAPSPDWMIAVNSLSLTDTQGDWISSIIIDLYPYDAGTDSGTHYTSGNQPTIPQGVVTSLQNVSPFSNEKVGTLTITLKQVLNNESFTESAIEVYPNPNSDGQLYISHAGELSYLEVYDVLGKKVKEFILTGSTQITADISEMNAGIYFLKMFSESGRTLSRKVVLQ